MAAAILSFAKLDPTVVVGGRVGTLGGSNARLGKSDFLVVESDDDGVSQLEPSVVVPKSGQLAVSPRCVVGGIEAQDDILTGERGALHLSLRRGQAECRRDAPDCEQIGHRTSRE